MKERFYGPLLGLLLVIVASVLLELTGKMSHMALVFVLLAVSAIVLILAVIFARATCELLAQAVGWVLPRLRRGFALFQLWAMT